MIAPFTVPATVPAESPQFPICMTVRTKRALFGHLVAAQPYFGACLRVFLGDSGDPRVMVCDRSDLIATPHVISKFGRTTVGVPAEDANAMTGCVLDRRSFPPGEPILIVRPKPGVEELERPGLLSLSRKKLEAIHPELFCRASGFTKIARGILSVTSLFAAGTGNPGWMGRLVGENDPDGQDEAVEAIAERLWAFSTDPAVVISVDPPVVAAYCSGFDHVAILRVPKSYDLAAGDRLLCCTSYGSEPIGQSDILHGPASSGAWNAVWPVLADPITDDAERLAAIKAAVPGELWQRVRQLGLQRLADGERCRDGRPWLSRVSASDQGKGWWKRKGGYLR